jgi:CIC family chloride channel protein
MVGIISFAMLKREVAERATRQLGEVLGSGSFPHVHLDHGLDLALARMGAHQVEILPVVSRADVCKLEGILTLSGVLDSYGLSPNDRS